ncbi:MAG: histidine phosphatase family protein [Stenotrophobium sp.]
MTTLILVRHGQAAFGSSNYDQLSPLGARQARALGTYWARLNFSGDAFHSGDMSRQQDSAKNALAALGRSDQPLRIDPALNEYDFEAILGTYIPMVARDHPELGIQDRSFHKNPKLFQAAFEKAIGYWLENRPHERAAFETWNAFHQRVTRGIRQLADTDRKTVVAFTSGGVIAVALKTALGLSDEMTFRLNWRIYNGSVHTFRMGRSGLSLQGYNSIAHLELSGDLSLITFR